MKLLMSKSLDGSLRAVDGQGVDALRKIAAGKLVTCEVKQPRNVQHHRLYWALLSKVWENLDEERSLRYPDVEALHIAVKICVGLRREIVLPDGRLGFEAGSIAFNKMDQTAFREFYDKVCDLLAKYFLPGVTSEQLKAEVAEMIGAAA